MSLSEALGDKCEDGDQKTVDEERAWAASVAKRAACADRFDRKSGDISQMMFHPNRQCSAQGPNK